MVKLKFRRREWIVTPTEHEIQEVAARVVSRYLQVWGQSTQERAYALQEAADMAKVEVEILEQMDQLVPQYPKGSKWPAFREAIDACWLKGNFELQQEAVVEVIKRFRGKDGEDHPLGMV